MSVRRIIGIGLIVALSSSCGRGDDVRPVEEPVDSSLVQVGEVKLTASIRGAREICYEASSVELGLDSLEGCATTAESSVLEPLAAAPLTRDQASTAGFATVLGSHFDLEVTQVLQDGRPVRWIQDGPALLVLGDSVLTIGRTVVTEVRYSFLEQQGVCAFRPDGASCALEPVD